MSKIPVFTTVADIEIESLRCRIAELEEAAQHCATLAPGVIYTTAEELAIRDLRQQAKGVEDFAEPYAIGRGGLGEVVYKAGLSAVIQLRKQADELEQDE